MKTLLKPLTPALLAAMALGLAAPASQAQNPNAAAALKLELVTPQSESFALTKLSGHPLRTSNQEQITSIADFLVDPKTGQLHFAVAGSGGGPQGETFRLIPMAALQTNNSGEYFTLTVDRNRWDKVGTMVESRLQGQININEEHQRRLAREYGLPEQSAAGAIDLVRASQLRGRQIRSGNELVGTVEDVVIDLNNKIAAPMVAPAAGFMAGGQKVLVPFTQLQVGNQAQGVITTTLSRNDFQQLQPGLSPTGQSSAMFNQQQPQSISHSALAVHQAISQNQSFASAGGIQVIPESRIVLRGYAESQQKKAEIERAAQQAAPGVRIDSEITVRNW